MMYDYNNHETQNNLQNENISNETNSNIPSRGRRKGRALKRTVQATAVGLALILSCGIGVSYATSKMETESQGTETTTSTVSAEALSVSGESGDGSVVYVAEKAADSVVEISTEYKQVNSFTQDLVTEGAGSGVVLTEDGYIVTNYHVVEDAETISVTLTDGTEYTAQLVGVDEETDLAVLKIGASGLTPATFADSDEIQVGQMAVAIGNPLGELGGTVTEGIISATDRDITIDGQTMTLLQTSAAVNSGNSGGGLFDSNGNLVGIVNAKSSGTDIEGLAFAIPSNLVSEVAQEIMENGYVTGRPQLGVSVAEYTSSSTGSQWGMTQGQQGSINESTTAGVYITAVTTENGLEAGDRIVSIDGTEITGASEMKEIISGYSVGDTVAVTVERDGQEVTVNVTLTEKVTTADTSEQEEETAAEDYEMMTPFSGQEAQAEQY